MIISALLLAGSLCSPAGAQSHHMVHAPGLAVVAHPKLINLYWDTMWDADNPGFSRATIDGLTRSLMATNYLNKANQYGVFSGSFGGSFLPVKNRLFTVCGNPPASITNPASILSWVTCQVTTPGTHVPYPDADTIYVVWLPARTHIESPGNIFNSCKATPVSASGKSFNAYNSASVNAPYIVMPMSCAPTVDDLTTNLSHELVESATDPGAMGWKDGASTATVISVGPVKIPTDQIADFCGSPLGSARLGGLAVEGYWSNSDGACAAGDKLLSVLTAMPALNPSSAAVAIGGQVQFAFTGAGGSVSWSLSRANGDDPGWISAAGLYHTPPAIWGVGRTATSTNTVAVTAVDQGGHAESGRVCLRGILGISVSSAGVIMSGDSRQLSLSNAYSTDFATVTAWSVAGGPASVNSSGVLSVGAVPGVHSKVTVKGDGWDGCGPFSVQRDLTVEPPVLSLDPGATLNFAAGAVQRYHANGAAGAALTWSVAKFVTSRDNPADTAGTIAAVAGASDADYTAPAKTLSDHSVKITATAADGRSASVYAQLLSDFKVSPASALLLRGQQKQFTTNIAPPGGRCGGTASNPIPCPAPVITWTLTGPGTLDSHGLYTAPNPVAGNASAQIKASVPDGRVSYADVTLVGEVRVSSAGGLNQTGKQPLKR